jgi:hypothetical protein
MLIREPRRGTTGPGQPGPARHVHRRRVYRGCCQVIHAGWQRLRLAATAARRTAVVAG